MRKDIYEGVQVYVNQNIKPNYAALARQYKADYRTVKHAYEKAKQVNDNLSEVKQKTIRQSKLDPFKQLIEEKLLLGCSAKSIFKFIEKKGFEGKYTIVREYCKQHKEEKIKKDIKCTIIQDILPLYIDEVVSQDTKEMVDQHLQHCEKCQKEYETMKSKLYIPVENKAPIIKGINKKWRKKKVIISFASILATAIILFGAFSYVFYYERVIPYSKSLIKIEMQNDNQLVSHYYGKSYAGVNETHPMPLEIDGEKKNVSFIFYTKTIADSPSRNLINNEKSLNEQEYTFNLVESEKVDAVYYVDFDVEKITAGKDSWDSILKRAVLIWEK